MLLMRLVRELVRKLQELDVAQGFFSAVDTISSYIVALVNEVFGTTYTSFQDLVANLPPQDIPTTTSRIDTLETDFNNHVGSQYPTYQHDASQISGTYPDASTNLQAFITNTLSPHLRTQLTQPPYLHTSDEIVYGTQSLTDVLNALGAGSQAPLTTTAATNLSSTLMWMGTWYDSATNTAHFLYFDDTNKYELVFDGTVVTEQTPAPHGQTVLTPISNHFTIPTFNLNSHTLDGVNQVDLIANQQGFTLTTTDIFKYNVTPIIQLSVDFASGFTITYTIGGSTTITFNDTYSPAGMPLVGYTYFGVNSGGTFSPRGYFLSVIIPYLTYTPNTAMAAAILIVLADAIGNVLGYKAFNLKLTYVHSLPDTVTEIFSPVGVAGTVVNPTRPYFLFGMSLLQFTPLIQVVPSVGDDSASYIVAIPMGFGNDSTLYAGVKGIISSTNTISLSPFFGGISSVRIAWPASTGSVATIYNLNLSSSVGIFGLGGGFHGLNPPSITHP